MPSDRLGGTLQFPISADVVCHPNGVRLEEERGGGARHDAALITGATCEETAALVAGQVLRGWPARSASLSSCIRESKRLLQFTKELQSSSRISVGSVGSLSLLPTLVAGVPWNTFASEKQSISDPPLLPLQLLRIPVAFSLRLLQSLAVGEQSVPWNHLELALGPLPLPDCGSGVASGTTGYVGEVQAS